MLVMVAVAIRHFRLGIEDELFEMLNDIFARPVTPHQARFVLPHLPSHLVSDGVDRRIHVVGFFAGLDGDVIRANEHDLGGVPILHDFEDDMRLDDFRVIEVQTLDLARDVIADRVRDL